ncbi:MAG: hypothetical protein N2513_03735 [Deltaproteobacteria bacterium]|nr:hypothetical protein [Deltaproteobacteria bacterium]
MAAGKIIPEISISLTAIMFELIRQVIKIAEDRRNQEEYVILSKCCTVYF